MTNSNPISVQLHSLRDLGDLDTMLDAAADAGYKAVELLEDHLQDADATKAKLEARGLVASSAHVGMAALREKRPYVLAGAKLLGLHHVFLSAFAPEERGGGAAEWDARGRELADLARWLRSQGVRLGYHNHNWEFEKLEDGSLPIERIFDNSGDSLFLELDLAWIIRTGADPSMWMNKYSDRLLAVHVKDIAPAGENEDQGGWADVGAGTVDWPRYRREALEAGAQWLIVEHDKPKTPALSVANSLKYLNGLVSAA
ncbi:sugar phosphate isomerase/epimerase [uncultured Martelella sp.]|uniref:sugar phosphate isomerase/epimerase family protein n=1 Tax=uncultured Martelella sp. TaxID=392331 RepID=UPI0029C9B039|nr:sugar phosphate isomerase/epimerase [uncultured Martelella sp.]